MTIPDEQPKRRTGRLALLVALGAALLLVCCGSPVAFFLGGLGGTGRDSRAISLGCGGSEPIDIDAKVSRLGRLGQEQMRNAAIIINVGQKMKVPPRGWVIAIGTALQESVLTNLPNLGSRNDHDSLGLFQQRPSQGWGTPDQLMDPEYTSRKFYEKLLTIAGWQTMALTDAAQAVQRSAYPDAYAKHEPLATQIVNLLANGAARAVGAINDLRCAAAGEIAASGWTIPVRGPIVSGFRTASRPTHNGVDLGVPKGTVVHAAAAGLVIVMRCNAVAPDGGDWGCNRDGSPSVHGCGWYVDILHAGGVVTRYCHMVAQPEVSVGQRVVAGQVIGQSGSSGHSSGPHLHFEVHLNSDRSFAGAVNPVPFMVQAGTPLGEQP
jgi:murein DD-endopeptidase MepM/ murein hydrolase activator NlpD